MLSGDSIKKPPRETETARASATGIGARENGEAPRPFAAAANSEAFGVIVGCSAPLADFNEKSFASDANLVNC